MSRRGTTRTRTNAEGVIVSVEARWYALTGARKAKRFPLDKPGDAKALRRAERAAADFLDTVNTDKRRGSEVDPNARVRFNEVADAWLAAKHGRPKTLAGYASLLDVHARPVFGLLPVNRVRSSEVRAWLRRMSDSGIAANTARNAYRVVKQVFDIAVEDGYIATNPCSRIPARDLPRSLNVRREMLCLNAEEVQAVARAADAIHPEMHYGTLIEFAAWTGLRSGEIAGLRAGSLDLLRGSVRVRESLSEVGGVLHAVPPKTYEERDVTLLEPHVPRLRAYMDAHPAKGPRGFVFTEPNGDQLRHVGWFYAQVFRPAVKATGLPRELRFHDLRHTHAALLIADGWHPLAISRRLGHSTITVTMDRYGHLLPSLEADLLTRSADTFSRSLAPTGTDNVTALERR
jgi:integrase